MKTKADFNKELLQYVLDTELDSFAEMIMLANEILGDKS